MSKEYPFVNPIIVTTDNGIIDGQHRYLVCQNLNKEVKYIKIPFANNQLDDDRCIEMIKSIKKEQSILLDSWFKKNRVAYKKQIEYCSSDDKIFYFNKYKDKLKSDKEYWETLRFAYIHSSNNFKYNSEIKKLFGSDKEGRTFLMTKDENEFLLNLPEVFKIYRGMTEVENLSGVYGISWTLERDIAEKFAIQYIHNYDTYKLRGTVKELDVNKKDIIAYFNSRSENEIIYLGNYNV